MMDHSQASFLFGDVRVESGESAAAAGLAQHRKTAGAAKTISDLYLADAETGVIEAARCSTLEELRERLANILGHNSSETRLRNARWVIRWFFPDGIDGALLSHFGSPTFSGLTCVRQVDGVNGHHESLVQFNYLVHEHRDGVSESLVVVPVADGREYIPEFSRACKKGWPRSAFSTKGLC